MDASPLMLSRRSLCLAAGIVIGLGATLAGCEPAAPPKPVFRGADITGAEYARVLSLPDVDGRPRALTDFKGKVTVVFFGYTQCPDVCPTTMVELAQVRKALGPNADKLQGVFVTIDPERDTPETLKAYMASFDPSFIALRGTPDETQAAAKEFKVYFAKVPGKVDGSYTMDHTAGAFILDAQGRPRVFEQYGGGADAMMTDVKAVLAAG